MRSRPLPLLLLVVVALVGLAPVAHAEPMVSAQVEPEEGLDVENEGGDQADVGTDTGEGAESSDGEDGISEGGEGEPGAESGAGEEEQQPAAEEEGPQWTYQMSRITLVMLLLLLLAVGALYYRMIGSRQRGRA